MKLTKDRCLSALKWAGDCFFEDRDGRQWDFKSFSDYKVLEQLIKEHFNNEPLKLEELEEGNVYWDNKYKEWCLITIMCKYPHKRYFDGTINDSKFEEGRFYRKQVEE